MDSDNLINSRLGKYVVQSEIGRGGMAVVYRGYDPDLNRTVAIKVLPPHLMWREEFVERFLREARAAAQLQHPNIVTIHNVGQQDEWYYFVMEYVEGQTLTDLIEQRGPFPSQEVINILRPLAGALDFAHKRGLVHRDIKPSNIISDPDVQVKLTDFGIARAGQETRLTATGAVMGTPEYMSPEQAKGRAVAAPSDQYSLAVVAYELLCGCVPFQAESTLALLHKVAYEPTPPIRQTRPELPPEVDTVLARALAKEPEQRYPTVTAFVESLERALAGAGIAQPAVPIGAAVPPVRPPTPPERLRAAPPPSPDQGQRRLLIILGALAGVAALVLLVAVFFILSGGSQSTETALDEQTPRPSPTLTPRLETPSPSAEPTTSNTPSGQDRATPEASVPANEDTPTSTASPLPSATATPTRTPTATQAPTRTPTRTVTPSPTPCAVPVHGAFSSAWQANAAKLGCPTAAAKSGVWMAQEDFQTGKMFWRQDNQKIYVLYNNGQWKRYDDTWQEGDPEFTCGPPASPPTPKRGFGKVWCGYSNVRQGLGDATSAEWGEGRLTQQFSGGSAIRTGSGRVYLLFNDGSWK